MPENISENTPTSNVSKDDVEAFCSFCVFLRSIFRQSQILFEEGGETNAVL
jgi:hypothetical protein